MEIVETHLYLSSCLPPAFLELSKYYTIQNGRLTAIFKLFDPKS